MRHGFSIEWLGNDFCWFISGRALPWQVKPIHAYQNIQDYSTVVHMIQPIPDREFYKYAVISEDKSVFPSPEFFAVLALIFD